MTDTVTGRRLLVLARHGQSEGNKQNLFTGWRDLPLTTVGQNEAYGAGKRLGDMGIAFDTAYSSNLARARESCLLMLGAMKAVSVPLIADQALNERDYGTLTGLNKDEARRRFGVDQVQIWRRSYEVAPPGGESLRDTVARVLPYYIGQVLPAVMAGRATLLVAHGNSLRALILALEHILPDQIQQVELKTGEMRLYRMNEHAAVQSQEIWQANKLAVSRPT